MIEPEFSHSNIADWLSDHPKGKPAIISDDGRQWTYGALEDWAAKLSGYLANDLTIRRGSRIAYLGPNDAAMVALFFACARIGAVLVPLNWRLTAPELSWIVADAEPHALVFDDEYAETAKLAIQGTCPLIPVEKLEQVSAQAAPVNGGLDDPVLIVYTSGTTGRPKGAVLQQRAIYVNALSSIDLHLMTPNDSFLVVLPLFHVGGLNISLTPALFHGATVHLHRRFDPQATLDALHQHRPDVLVMVPATMKAIMALPGWEDADFSCLRMVTTGSMIVSTQLIAAWEDHGVSVVMVYGSTETCPIAGYTRPGDGKSRPEFTGKAALHSDIRIAAEQGKEGEIEVRGGNVMCCYWRNEDETERAFDGDWFRTGDIGYLTEDGHLVVCDRLKNMIISGGENIYPAEVEQVIASTAEVRECCVVGIPDDKWGEAPVAVIVAAEDTRSQEVEAAVKNVLKSNLARFKHPRKFVISESLPRNAMGKVVTDEVRKLVDRGEN